jgi:hypothetical protein
MISMLSVLHVDDDQAHQVKNVQVKHTVKKNGGPRISVELSFNNIVH